MPAWWHTLTAKERPLMEALHELVIAGEAEWVE